jgi:DNA-binding IclR family transcriptional regulator
LLEQLRDKVGATAHLGIRHGTAMMYLLRAASQHELVSSMIVPVGTRYPVHAVACGRALLFDLSDAALVELFAGFDFRAYPSPAPQSLAALQAVLVKERRKGYVHCASAFVAAKRSIGAPVRDNSGAAIAAINVSDANVLIKDPDGAVKDAVLATASAISARLGYRPSSGLGNGDRTRVTATTAPGMARV